MGATMKAHTVSTLAVHAGQLRALTVSPHAGEYRINGYMWAHARELGPLFGGATVAAIRGMFAAGDDARLAPIVTFALERWAGVKAPARPAPTKPKAERRAAIARCGMIHPGHPENPITVAAPTFDRVTAAGVQFRIEGERLHFDAARLFDVIAGEGARSTKGRPWVALDVGASLPGRCPPIRIWRATLKRARAAIMRRGFDGGAVTASIERWFVEDTRPGPKWFDGGTKRHEFYGPMRRRARMALLFSWRGGKGGMRFIDAPRNGSTDAVLARVTDTIALYQVTKAARSA